MNNTRTKDELYPVNIMLNSESENLIRTRILCRGFPCPNFTVVKEVTPYVQERRYDSQEIISSTNNTCQNITSSVMQSYIKLHEYRKGHNLVKGKLAIAVPIVIEVSKVETPNNCNTSYKVWLFTRFNNENNSSDIATLPQPHDDGVKIERVKAFDVYVRTFSGNYSEPEIEVTKLKNDLQDANLCFATESFILALYDPPWKKGGRRNEIWIESC